MQGLRQSRICRIRLKIPHEQVDECDIETLIPKLAGTTWLNHYLESLPNLEAQKQILQTSYQHATFNG